MPIFNCIQPLPHPCPSATTNLFSICMVLPFPEWYINGSSFIFDYRKIFLWVNVPQHLEFLDFSIFADQMGIKWHRTVGLLCMYQLTKDGKQNSLKGVTAMAPPCALSLPAGMRPCMCPLLPPWTPLHHQISPHM